MLWLSSNVVIERIGELWRQRKVGLRRSEVRKMPVKCPKGIKPRYRVRKFRSGKKVRLAFCKSRVVEVKSLKSGKKRKVLRKRIRKR